MRFHNLLPDPGFAVTKWLALAMLIVFPVGAFFLGRWYQHISDNVAIIRIVDRKDSQLAKMAQLLEACKYGQQASVSAEAR